MYQDMQPKQSFSQRIGYRLVDILRYRHFEIAELAGAVLWGLCSVVLINPWASAFGSSVAFHVMASLMPEAAWGIAALILAGNQFAAMLSERRRWRIIAAGLLFAWALFVGSMIGLSNPVGTGAATYTGIGLLSLFAFLRAVTDPP